MSDLLNKKRAIRSFPHLSWASLTWANRSRSLFWHERPWPERIVHGHTFDMSDRAMASQSLICPDRSEWIAHSCSFDMSDLSNLSKWGNERWAYERIPNPAHDECVPLRATRDLLFDSDSAVCRPLQTFLRNFVFSTVSFTLWSFLKIRITPFEVTSFITVKYPYIYILYGVTQLRIDFKHFLYLTYSPPRPSILLLYLDSINSAICCPSKVLSHDSNPGSDHHTSYQTMWKCLITTNGHIK